MTWDWREQPDVEWLAAIIFDLSEGKLHVSAPETGCDEHALVISTVPLDADGAEDAFRRWWVSEDDTGDRLDTIEVTSA
jgi:hypothetical protein